METHGNADGHSHRASKAKRKPGGRNGPVTIRKFPKEEWEIAKDIAGTTMRLFIAQDGVIIANSTRRPAWLAPWRP